MGTPPQNITAVLDTGSADLYLNAASAGACQDLTRLNSCRGGTYAPTDSSTYTLVGTNQFSSKFGDGSSVSGDFATDIVAFGDLAVEDAQFGVAVNINNTSGFAISLMGIGYSYLESSATPYPNMPEMLHQAEIINSRLYSIYLDHIDGGSGTILFGGIDTAKLKDGLTTLNLLPYKTKGSSLVTEFVVPVTNITVVNNDQAETILQANPNSADAIPALLDTGSSAWTVPKAVYDSIKAALNGIVDGSNNLVCSHRDDNIQIEVVFGGVTTIVAPASEFIIPIYDPVTNEPYSAPDGQPLCAFMIQPDLDGQFGTQGFLTLGDSILRSMYVVYDLDNGQVSIGQSAPGATGNEVTAVPAGPNGVAKAVSSVVPVTTVASNTHSIASELQATRTILVSTASHASSTASGTDVAASDTRASPEASPGHASTSNGSGTEGDGSSALRDRSSYLVLQSVLWTVLFGYVMF